MNISRRQFLVTSGAATAAYSLLPGKVLGANEKVNLAAIGIGQQGGGITRNFASNPKVNLVALCDVDIDSDSPIARPRAEQPHAWADYAWGNKNRTPAACAAQFPKAKRYRDFRKMFDEMGDQIDAVCIGTPDHTHFPITMAAMMLGIHVYVEKPLARTFEECTKLIEAEKKFGVVTQMGNQGHSGTNYFQFKEWVEQGIIKDVYHVDAMMNSPRRWHPWDNVSAYPPAEPIPGELDWDTWHTSVAKMQAFSKKLHYGNWRGWHQFGTGCFGDWGAHILDTIHEFLDLGLPEKITATHLLGRNDLIFPKESTINFQFPERNGMPAMDIDWYDGQKNWLKKPAVLGDEKVYSPGKVIYSKEYIFKGQTHAKPLEIVPREKYIEMLKAGEVRKDFGKHSNHYQNFINAVRGEEATRSPFSVAGPLCQMFALGCIAQRLGGELHFDRRTQQITNNKQANSLLKDQVRRGWEQYYRI
ncbi:Gfo/Idh/MocA family oxidoreductase [Coraliomargarita akajimensis]|uniref:Oxidoreductase domain protein n=1 Tax=Coraliomargarita akajimensis (strain DSM 45221 / IAM 15411 / JCM 23193 / KCTC 12865 / 04OKA010-24) TaxID=583355 RepID=D5ENS3_CORAD|nr:Gfo/Idh/MocA family oxidoreductase [Coraliomargarita akajimensis]ADE53582.1 oxidoreductase domain protein [Coraliomargarita akajimensis DSM 45221]